MMTAAVIVAAMTGYGVVRLSTLATAPDTDQIRRTSHE